MRQPTETEARSRDHQAEREEEPGSFNGFGAVCQPCLFLDYPERRKKPLSYLSHYYLDLLLCASKSNPDVSFVQDPTQRLARDRVQQMAAALTPHPRSQPFIKEPLSVLVSSTEGLIIAVPMQMDYCEDLLDLYVIIQHPNNPSTPTPRAKWMTSTYFRGRSRVTDKCHASSTISGVPDDPALSAIFIFLFKFLCQLQKQDPTKDSLCRTQKGRRVTT